MFLLNEAIFKSEEITKSFMIKGINTEKEIHLKEYIAELKDEKNNKIGKSHIFYTASFPNNFEFDGLLGNDYLSGFLIYMNLPDKLALISNIEPYSLILNDFYKIPIIFENGHISLNGNIHNNNFQLLLDTGSGISYIDLDLAEKLGLIKSRTINYFDLSGKVVKGQTYLANEFCLKENECEKDIEFLAGKTFNNFQPKNHSIIKGILGADWMKRYYLFLDYKGKTLYIKKKPKFFWE